MATKIQTKAEQDPLLDDANSQSEREFVSKNVTTRTNSDAVLLDGDSDVSNTEIDSETTFSDFSTQKEGECVTKHPLKHIKSETITCGNFCEVNIKTEIEEQTLISQNEREFPPEDPLMVVNGNSDHEMVNEVYIKEEPCWPEAETSSLCDDIKDGNFTPVKSARLCTEVYGDSDKSPLSIAKVSVKDINFYNQEDHLECVSQSGAVEEHVLSKQSDIYSDGRSQAYLKQSKSIPKDESPHKCRICEKSFTKLSQLQIHNMIHEGKKIHQCEICDKTFVSLSKLERHILVHDGKKPHRCKTCDKSFTQLANLKRHQLAHDGIKPYKCNTCGKSFTESGSLKEHTFIHEGKKPLKCKICGQSFTHSSSLRRHLMVHEGIKPYKCKTCDRSFAQFSHLEVHNLTHEGKKPHKCNICDKRFTQSSQLRRHNLTHEGIKPHKCETCNRSFTRYSYLKMHNWIHVGVKPYKCNTCDKSFTQLSHLESHNWIHEGKRPFKCKTCDKSFTRMSHLKKHNLSHNKAIQA